MSADMQMARGEIEGGYNLAVGEPVLIQQHVRFPPFVVKPPFPYPTLDGHPALITELRKRHNERYIVVTNGAKQALAAAFYAYKKNADRSAVAHPAPYWPSYPTLARQVGMYFRGGRGYDDYVNCVTHPNNPDGAEHKFGEIYDVWDAVYAHSVYGWDYTVPEHQCSVWSASKLLGLSGVRVGWLATEEKWLADAAREHVELTTSGVSVPAQQIVADALLALNVEPAYYKEAYRQARRAMLKNGKLFREIMGEYCVEIEGVPRNGKGMFAWFQTAPATNFAEALRRAKVAAVSGDACGMDKDSRFNCSGWWRMNMCHDNNYTEAALLAVRGALYTLRKERP